MRPSHERFVPAAYRDIIQRLEAWTEQQGIVDKAVQECRRYLRECESKRYEGYERLQGLDEAQVEVTFHQHFLRFQHGDLGIPLVMTELSVWERSLPDGRSGRQLIGVYRYGSRLDGKATGDFLQFMSRQAEDAQETEVSP